MQYEHLSADTTAQGKRLVAVTPSDTVDLPEGRARFLWVQEAGTLEVLVHPADPVVTVNVDLGPFPFEVTRVLTGSTATVLAAY